MVHDTHTRRNEKVRQQHSHIQLMQLESGVLDNGTFQQQMPLQVDPSDSQLITALV